MKALSPKETETIFQRLQSDYDYCVSAGYEVVGVFLFGSQNYGVSLETSDIDTKAVVIPSLMNNIVWGKNTISAEVERENGKLSIYDLESLQSSIKKQSMNFVEILFTPYRILNPVYEAFYNPMFEHREGIAKLNTFKAVHCVLSMAHRQHSRLFTKLPANEARVSRAGYDYKAFAELLRLEYALNALIAELPYECALVGLHVETLRKIKSYEMQLTPEQVKENADAAVKHMSGRVDMYDEIMGQTIDQEMVELVDSVTRNIILRYIKTEVERYDRADGDDRPSWCGQVSAG